jgi:glucose/arabinose dehydrogenase
MFRRADAAAVLVGVAAWAACARGDAGPVAGSPCDGGNAGLALPEGFCAQVVADDVGRARHLVAAPNGDIFVAVAGRREDPGGGVLALRDTTRDGRADVVTWFARTDVGGTGIALTDRYLYFGPDDAVLRYRYRTGQLEADAPPDTIVRDLPAERSHRAKSLAIGPDGALYVNVGSPSNACQREDRRAGSPGLDPCPELERRAGIWRFDANRVGQTQADGERFATGIRNAVALAFGPDGRLYVVQHGRDQLAQNWPELFDERKSAENPGEEMFRVQRGDDFGWPYCYYDVDLRRKVLAPEYGGDGRTIGRCARAKDPLLVFPGHWGPNAIVFYTAAQFPPKYRGGAFVAFHGSWNRAPLPQQGYNVVFVPFRAGEPAGTYEVFADGFAGGRPDPRDAAHRPTGLAVAPDGSLLVSDDQGGRIYRIAYAR